MMGMCFLSSGQTDPGAGCARCTGLRDGTVFALTARRWLAERLGVEPEPQALAAARAAALAADPPGTAPGSWQIRTSRR